MTKEENTIDELVDALLAYAKATGIDDGYVVGYLNGVLHRIMDHLPEIYRGIILEQLNSCLDKIKTRMEAIPNDHHLH